jgi:hypothetical protein
MRITINYRHKRAYILPLKLVLLLTFFGCGSDIGNFGSSAFDGSDVFNGSNVFYGSDVFDGSDDDLDSSIEDSVTLSWGAPTTDSDGSDLTDLAGYKVYYGTSYGTYSQSIDIGSYTGAVINDLSSGTWCFAVTAYDTSGNESDYSSEVCQTIG